MASILSPDDISGSEFDAALARYPDVIKAVSETKGAKPGQQTLVELDEYRYTTAPVQFGPGASRKAMSLDDIKTLVAWKLKHGKFRPTLMKLVESNDKATAADTVKEALAVYNKSVAASKGKDKADVVNAHAQASIKAVAVLSRLRGIGPATASLLAAVHYPEQTIFFSDEAYAWLCGASSTGYQRPSKYNDKEYAELAKAAAQLMVRLGKTAQDVEQVAYVLINDNGPLQKEAKPAPKPKAKDSKPAKEKTEKAAKPEQKEKTDDTATDNKRKQPPTEPPTGSRRSSRLRSG